jgi:hypothetical protein
VPVENLIALELAMLAVFLSELVLKVSVWGPLAYLRAKLTHKLDMAILVVALVLGVLAGVGVGGVDRPTALSILFLRALRLGRYLGALPGFSATSASIGDLLPMLGRYMVIVLSVNYCFAVIGCELFAGRLNEDKWPDVDNSSYGNAPMEGVLDFDTLPRAMVVMFYQMLLNDWPVVMEGLVASHQNLWPRAFFILFLIIQCAIVLNVVCVEERGGVATPHRGQPHC